jgi:Ser/Thr protein kinase RdoA (MazF antagonist)
MKIETLPHCFVHGDIIKTNLIKDSKGKLLIIDFAVSNYYPRIQELAVLACNVLFDDKDKLVSEKNLEIVLDEYQKTIKLTPEELKKLPDYIKLAHGMHVLSASYEKAFKNNCSRENDYWLEQGRAGLKQMM